MPWMRGPLARGPRGGKWRGRRIYQLVLPRLSTLTDPFDSAANWGLAGGAVTGGQATAVPTSAGPYLLSNNLYDLTDSAASIQFVQTPLVGSLGTTAMFFSLISDNFLNQQRWVWITSGGAPFLATHEINNNALTQSSSLLAYSAATQWLRIRSIGMTVYFDYSADSVNWTNFISWTATIPIARFYVWLLTQCGVSETSVGTAIWDNLNLYNYTPTASDVVGITDSIAGLDVGRSQTDSVGISDSIAGLDVGRTITDQIGVTDSGTFTISGSNYTPSATDAIGLTDSVITQQDWVRSQTDPIGISDSFILQDAYDQKHTDFVGITDSFTTQDNYSQQFTDPVGISDSTVTQQDWVRAQTDAVGITDPTTTQQDWVRAQTDPVGVVDNFITQDAYSQQSTDPVSITDSVTIIIGRTVIDPIGITDNIATQQDWVRAAQTDPIGITDSSVFTTSLIISAADSIAITDSVITQQNWVRTQTDLLGITDSFTRDAGRNQADAISITDSLRKTVDLTQTDQVGITDSPSITISSTTADSIGITDTGTFSITRSISGADSIGIGDNTSLGIFTQIVTNTIGIHDSATFINKPQTDQIGITDSAIFGTFTQIITNRIGIADHHTFITRPPSTGPLITHSGKIIVLGGQVVVLPV